MRFAEFGNWLSRGIVRGSCDTIEVLASSSWSDIDHSILRVRCAVFTHSGPRNVESGLFFATRMITSSIHDTDHRILFVSSAEHSALSGFAIRGMFPASRISTACVSNDEHTITSMHCAKFWRSLSWDVLRSSCGATRILTPAMSDIDHIIVLMSLAKFWCPLS